MSTEKLHKYNLRPQLPFRARRRVPFAMRKVKYGGVQREGFQRATADFVRFHCPLFVAAATIPLPRKKHCFDNEIIPKIITKKTLPYFSSALFCASITPCQRSPARPQSCGKPSPSPQRGQASGTDGGQSDPDAPRSTCGCSRSSPDECRSRC